MAAEERWEYFGRMRRLALPVYSILGDVVNEPGSKWACLVAMATSSGVDGPPRKHGAARRWCGGGGADVTE